MLEYLAAVLISWLVFGGGFAVGIIVYAWLYERHKVRVAEMNQRGYNEGRETAMRVVAENQIRGRVNRGELPQNGTDDIMSFEDSLKVIGFSDQERERLLKDKHRV